MSRQWPADPKAAKLLNDFQAKKTLRCRRCAAEIKHLELCDWKDGNRDCIRQVCAACYSTLGSGLEILSVDSLAEDRRAA